MSTATTPRTGRGVPARAGSPLPIRQRRPGWVAAALALIIGSVVVAGWQYQRAGEKTPVVVVIRAVAPGHVITRADLSSVAVAGPVTAIGAEHVEAEVGQRAAVTLLPGMLLQRSMVSSTDALQAGQAQVGVAVTSGQIPADGLAAGDAVQVLQLAEPSSRSGADVPPALTLVEVATVWSSHPDPSSSGGTVLSLVVPQDLAAPVASASGAGRVALVKVPTGQ